MPEKTVQSMSSSPRLTVGAESAVFPRLLSQRFRHQLFQAMLSVIAEIHHLPQALVQACIPARLYQSCRCPKILVTIQQDAVRLSASIGLICSFRSESNPNRGRAAFTSLCGFTVGTSCNVCVLPCWRYFIFYMGFGDILE